MSASAINKLLDSLSTKSSKITDRFIASGRGHERPSDTFAQLRAGSQDPLSIEWLENYERRSDLMSEVERRMGPGHRRLARGFGPIKF